MSELLVIGADGMLGRCWTELLTARGIEHVATELADLDITDPSAVEGFIPPGTRWVVNCAAYTLVDAAEEHEALANDVNGHAVGRMAERCRAVGAKLLHYSTDYVFDGNATTPYRTDHALKPVNAYGRSKALGEELIARSGVEHLLVRSSWLYAPWANNCMHPGQTISCSRSGRSPRLGRAFGLLTTNGADQPTAGGSPRSAWTSRKREAVGSST
jgi:dTDP-4-dehydrorhamnose reductase